MTKWTLLHGHAGTVCEDLARRSGSLVFLAPDGSQLAVLNKTAERMFTDKSNMSNVTAMKPPLPPSGTDPTLQSIMDAAPPMVYAGGYNVLDPKNCEQKKAGGIPCKTWDPTATGGWNS
jgi:hypothetical protein